MDENVEVIVCGGGLAGLAAAATAAQAGRRVLIVDGHPPGGRARTLERGGFRFNLGAHALYLGGPAERVLDRLGIAMPSGEPPSTDSWGRAGHRVSPLPFSPSGALRSRLVGPVGKAKLGAMLLGLRGLDTATLADRSAESWLAGLGLPPAAAEIVRTLAHVASYADDFDAISADAVAGQIQAAVASGVRYLDGGWQVLVDALAGAATAAGATMRIGAPVVGIDGSDRSDDPARGVVVGLGDGTVVHAGAAVLALGGPEGVASLLGELPRWNPLGAPATVACLDLGLRRPPPKKVLFGVGEPLYLSTHAPPADLAPPGAAVVHVMRYGAREAETDRAALWVHAALAGIGEEDVIEQRFLARMVVTHAVPVPGSGLVGRPSVDSTGMPGVFIAGDWVGPDGLLADGVLASGATAGATAAKHALGRRVGVT